MLLLCCLPVVRSNYYNKGGTGTKCRVCHWAINTGGLVPSLWEKALRWEGASLRSSGGGGGGVCVRVGIEGGSKISMYV